MAGLVSIIVPTRNSAKFLGACLDSIRSQTYDKIEIIVVDNYSTDDTRDIAAGYTSKVLVKGPERSAQVNFGVCQAMGEYVYKVDSDFVLDREVVGSCVTAVAAGFDAVVVHNSPDVRVGWIARVRKFEVDMYKYDVTHSSARFLKKAVFESLGGFNEAITAGEDYDLQNRLNVAGYKTGFVAPEALHLGEPTSFWKHMKKYYVYGGEFVAFAAYNRGAAKRQLRFVRPVYLKHWRKFVRHPLVGTGFIAYDVCKYAFGATGYLSRKLQTVVGSRVDPGLPPG